MLTRALLSLSLLASACVRDPLLGCDPSVDERCLLPACGDGSLSDAEACDDGNLLSGDGCSEVCSLEVCGDGLLNNAQDGALTETCDDGNALSGDGCDAACSLEVCGDSVLQPALGEECDGGEACQSDCRLEIAAACAQAAPLGAVADNSAGSVGFAGSCAGAEGREQLLVFTPGLPGQSGLLTVTLHAEADLSLYLRERCHDPAFEVGCVDDQPAGVAEVLSAQVSGGRELSLFVDGASLAEVGPFSLEVSFTPDICGANEVATPDGCAVISPPTQFTLGGQSAWFHDDGFSYGYFHTYDALQAAGPSDAPRRVRVFLPREYEASGASYPVIYMNDGQSAFFPEGFAGKHWHVAETLSALDNLGEIQRVIVVAVYPLQRDREYTHSFWADGRECCLLPGYAQYLARDVKGFIDANYRTLSAREHTMIVGSSHGGLAAFHTAALHPEVFGVAAALSSSFWAGVDLNRVLNTSLSLSGSALLSSVRGKLSNASLRPRFWLDWGLKRDGGAHNSVTEALATYRGEEMVSLLQQEFGYVLGEDLLTFVDPVGGHDEDAWAYRFGLLVAQFFPAP